MTMSSDRFDELIPEALDVTLTTGDESRSRFKLVCSRDLIISSHHAGRRKRLNACSAGSNRLTVLVCLNQKVSGLRFGFERCHAGFPVRNIKSVEQNCRAGKKAKICLNLRTISSR